MSSIDLSNPQVLKNFIKAQANEERGEFEYRDNVLVFIDQDGNEFVAPQELKDEIKVKAKKKKDDSKKDDSKKDDSKKDDSKK